MKDNLAYFTGKKLKEWADEQPDKAYYCEACLTMLRQTNEGLFYCPNELCAIDAQAELPDNS
mgnify:CR=1 FL=1